MANSPPSDAKRTLEQVPKTGPPADTSAQDGFLSSTFENPHQPQVLPSTDEGGIESRNVRVRDRSHSPDAKRNRSRSRSRHRSPPTQTQKAILHIRGNDRIRRAYDSRSRPHAYIERSAFDRRPVDQGERRPFPRHGRQPEREQGREREPERERDRDRDRGRETSIVDRALQMGTGNRRHQGSARDATEPLRRAINGLKRVLLSRFVQPGNDILDLCCGQGADLPKFAHLRIRSYFGIDFAPSALDEARHRASTNNRFKRCVRELRFLQTDLRTNVVQLPTTRGCGDVHAGLTLFGGGRFSS